MQIDKPGGNQAIRKMGDRQVSVIRPQAVPTANRVHPLHAIGIGRHHQQPIGFITGRRRPVDRRREPQQSSTVCVHSAALYRIWRLLTGLALHTIHQPVHAQDLRVSE